MSDVLVQTLFLPMLTTLPRLTSPPLKINRHHWPASLFIIPPIDLPRGLAIVSLQEVWITVR